MTMQLEVINYERVIAQDDSEMQKLVRICSEAGIFFLDVQGSSHQGLLPDLQPIIGAQRNFFAQEPGHKMAYSDNRDGRGYDTFEEISVQRLKLSREQQVQGELKLPADLQAVEGQVGDVASSVDSILRKLSALLCKSCDPPIKTLQLDDMKNPGLSNLCLGLATATAGTELMGSHVDEDLLTITFYNESFLEVQDKETGEWKLVEVLMNMPLVNIGETFEQVSNGRLHAPYHRVKQTERHIDLIMYDLNASPQ